jgi:voltage-gated potassium channel
MALLSVLSLINLVLFYLVREPTVADVVEVMSFVLTIGFAVDFAYRLKTAPDRRRYFFHGFGWADMLASIPLAQTNVLRLFRLIKVYRLLRDYGARNILRALVRDRAGSALLMLLFAGILVMEFGSMLLLAIEETAPGANITTASDALWYVIETISTVGYGDQYPVTNAGRIVGTVIIVVGVGIFGTLTGYLANLFLTPSKTPEDGESADAAAPAAELSTRLAELKELAAKQQAAITELENLIADGRPG